MSVFFVESSENSHLCPACQGMLRYRDSRPRIRKKEGGMKEHLMIRRFRCQNCHSYHNELPDCLVPYKHYENLQRIEGYLRTVGYQILNLGEELLFTSDLLLNKIRNRHQNWLELILRLIYNSGGFLMPIRW